MNLSSIRLNEDNRSKRHKFRITNVPRATLDDLNHRDYRKLRRKL